jgi:F-type H+-transporting ATPase subunit gamma
MASLRDIKRRITGVKSTQKITRAMKMVAAAKLRRAQQSIEQARPYAYEMRRLVNSLGQRASSDAHPLLRQGGGGKIGVIVVTSDRGLCGGFNASIVNQASALLTRDFEGREVEFTLVGRKGIEMMRRRSSSIRKTFTALDDKTMMAEARAIISDLVNDFLSGETDEVYCLYNEFKSAVQQKVTLEKLLPFSVEDVPEEEAEHLVDFIYEPSQTAVLDQLLVKHLNIQMHRILFESAASEFGARMTAMDAASRNAGEVIDRLTLLYNRARQDAITKELIEVVSGAEAL